MFDRFWFCLYLWRLVGVFGVDMKSVSVMEGDSVTLNSDLTGTQTFDEILWTFGTNRNLAKSNGKTSKIYDGPDGRFRDRLKLDHQTGSLTITDTRTTDSGLYEAEISRRSSEDKHRFNVTVFAATTPDPQTPPHSPSHSPSHSPAQTPAPTISHLPHPRPQDSVSLIIVLIFAAGSLLIVAVIVMFCICRKHRDAVHEDEAQAAAKLYKHTGLMTESDVTEVIYTCFITEQ